MVWASGRYLRFYEACSGKIVIRQRFIPPTVISVTHFFCSGWDGCQRWTYLSDSRSADKTGEALYAYSLCRSRSFCAEETEKKAFRKWFCDRILWRYRSREGMAHEWNIMSNTTFRGIVLPNTFDWFQKGAGTACTPWLAVYSQTSPGRESEKREQDIKGREIPRLFYFFYWQKRGARV